MDISLINNGIQTNSDKLCNVQNNLEYEFVEYSQKEYIVNDKNKDLKEKDIKNAVNKINKFLQGEDTHLEYETHKVFKNQFIVKIINNKTKEIIKEIPPKKILDMVAEICKLAGVIVDEKA